MCPDPQLLSIYLDGELPSPWKEKLEAHLADCSECREKLNNFTRMQELFKKNTHEWRTFVEKENKESVPTENELMEASKERIWKKLESRQRFRPYKSLHGVWQRRLSVPIPLAAAAALVLIFGAVFLFRPASNNNNYYASPIQSLDTEENFGNLVAYDDIPSIPTTDLNSVLQYLGVDRSEVIILQLPESRNFSRVGEPAIIRSADYTGR